MVYFTCNSCGDPLKKPQVEKHYLQKCRSCNVLTCMDCLKEFVGDEYKKHMTCMSEEQRYSKEGRAGWDPAVGQGNKGEKRQNQWTENLRRILAEATDLDGDVRNILDMIQEHDNIPRKKPKFINFVKNIMRNRARPHSIDKTWELFEQAIKPAASPEPMDTKTEEAAKDESEVNGSEKESKKSIEDVEDKKAKKKKRKRDKEEEEELEEPKGGKKKKSKRNKEEEEVEEPKEAKKRKGDEAPVEENDNSPKKAKFDWDEVITACLKQKDGNEMKLVKLKKKCVSQFFSLHEGTHKTKEEVGAKFDKKLKKRTYRLLKDRVKLITDDNADEPEEEQGPAPRPEGWVSAPAAPPAALSFNKWEGASVGNSAQTEKFRRLMGIKSAPKPEEVAGGWGRDDRKMMKDLEQNFDKARETHFGGRSFTM